MAHVGMRVFAEEQNDEKSIVIIIINLKLLYMIRLLFWS